MHVRANSAVSNAIDVAAALVAGRPSSPVIVDDRLWDGSLLGDIAFEMVSNKNIVKQQQRVIRACVAAGLDVVLLHVDMGAPWTPAVEDYSGLGGPIIKLSLGPWRRGRMEFPSPFTLLGKLPALKASLPGPPFRLLATYLDDWGSSKLLCYWAKQCGLTSVVLQEGMTIVEADGDNPRPGTDLVSCLRAAAGRLLRQVPHDLFRVIRPYSYADYFCAYGEAAKEELVRFGRSPETIFVVGDPGLDQFVHLPAPRAAVSVRGTVMYVQQYIVDNDIEVGFCDQLARICCDENGDRLRIKLHPLSQWDCQELLQRIPRTEGRASRLEVVKSGDATEMLDDVDLLVTVNSTTAYHALVRGIPVVTVNYLTQGFGEFNAYRHGGAIDVRDPSDLGRAIQGATRDEAVRRGLHEGAKRVIEQHLYRLDGHASERIARVLCRLAKGECGVVQVSTRG